MVTTHALKFKASITGFMTQMLFLMGLFFSVVVQFLNSY